MAEARISLDEFKKEIRNKGVKIRSEDDLLEVLAFARTVLIILRNKNIKETDPNVYKEITQVCMIFEWIFNQDNEFEDFIDCMKAVCLCNMTESFLDKYKDN